MQAEIKGTTLPVLEMTLNPGDKLVAESGELSWITQTIQVTTTTQSGGAKGMMGVLKRAVGGGGIFMSEYVAQGGPGTVAFATKLPGTIMPLKIDAGDEYMVHRHGFLCASDGIVATVGFQKKLGVGIFGGEGFILQKLAGTADAWVELDGEIVIYDLQPGEILRVHPGHVGMFQAQMTFDVTMLPGIKNKLFGGDGLFLAQLTGPGRVWLQTLTVSGLAQAIQPYLPSADSGSSGSSSLGGTIGGLLGGN